MVSSYGQVGALLLPLGSPQASLLDVADPTRAILLECFARAIVAETQAAWTVVSSQLRGINPKPVAKALPYQGARAIMLGENVPFPLLCLYRQGSRLEALSGQDIVRRSTLVLEYILPALSALGIGKLESQLNAVDAVLSEVIRTGSHPAYGDGYSLQSEGIAFGQNYQSEFTVLEVEGKSEMLLHPMLVCTVDVQELCKTREDAPSPGVPFEGTDATYFEPIDGYALIVRAREDV